ncbi:hypothetical protein [Methylorubrum podarium]|jgi:hypothetical protein|uniref:hypothetical protein n=1 Tax=Methylorubrum podarium TaxID=200476 RepID=UPI001EE301C9|nr:hypothetical protein [Methylorubrum podarium]GJE73063.1 hypothetical protein CHKEEEPN_4626 [Methylorubrum podarium]
MEKLRNTLVGTAIVGGLLTWLVSIPNREPTQATARPDDGISKISIGSLRGNRAGFGTVLELSFVVSNRNNYPVKDVTFACILRAQSGTHVSSVSGTVYQRVQANGSVMVNDMNMGFIPSQTDGFACAPTSFSPAI